MSSHRLARWSRIAVFAAIPLMGITLLLVVWSTVPGIQSASDTVIRGEADALYSSIKADYAEVDGVRFEDRLPEILEAHQAEGLRYLAIVDADGNIRGQAGTTAGDPLAIAAWARQVTPA